MEYDGKLELCAALIDWIELAVVYRKTLIGGMQLNAADACRFQAFQFCDGVRCVRMYGAERVEAPAVVCLNGEIIDAVLCSRGDRDIQQHGDVDTSLVKFGTGVRKHAVCIVGIAGFLVETADGAGCKLIGKTVNMKIDQHKKPQNLNRMILLSIS